RLRARSDRRTRISKSSSWTTAQPMAVYRSPKAMPPVTPHSYKSSPTPVSAIWELPRLLIWPSKRPPASIGRAYPQTTYITRTRSPRRWPCWNKTEHVIETTAGRVVFNAIWPEKLGFFNKAAGKKQLSDIIWRCYQVAGQNGTVETLDRLKELGFAEATKAGISIGISDMIIPKEKETELQNA